MRLAIVSGAALVGQSPLVEKYLQNNPVLQAL